MDRQTAKNIVANIGVIQAYAEGKTIEFFSFGKWKEIFQPDFDSPATHYRVKPEPIEIEIWYKDGVQVCDVAVGDDVLMTGLGYRKMKMREVL